MADGPDITIGLKTLGADAAAGELWKVTKELANGGQGLTNLASAQSKVSSSSFSMKSAMSGVGFQIQDIAVQAEMGTSAIRIISQQVPQMLGAFGPWGAVAGSVVALGIPAAAALGLIGKSAKDAVPSVDELKDRLEALATIYAGFEKQNQENLTKGAAAAAKDLKQTLSGVDVKVGISLDTTNLEAARAKAAAALDLARERVNLAQTEQQLTITTGQASLKLTQARETSLQNIFNLELQIAEIARKAALDAAEQKAAAAKEKVAATDWAAGAAGNTFSEVDSEVKTLLQEAEVKHLANLEKVAKIEAQIADITREIANPTRKPYAGNGSWAPTPAEDPLRQIGALGNQKAALLRDPYVVEKYTAANEKDGTLDLARGNRDAAAEAQREAAKAMEAATRALENLRSVQGIERGSELGLKQNKAEDDAGKEITAAAMTAIEQIQASGLAQNPGAGSEAVAGLQKIVQDTTPDGKQGAQVAGLLQQLSNNLTGKDAVIASSLTSLLTTVGSAVTRLQGIDNRIRALESAAAQKR